MAPPGAAPAPGGSVPAAAPADPPAAGTRSDLGPTSDPPWNPPRPIERRRAWEQVLLFPGRVVTLPLSGLGLLANRSLLAIENHSLIERVATSRHARSRSFALRILPPNMGDRTGFGGTAEADAWLFRGRARTRMSVSHSTTYRDYHDTRVQLFGEHYLEFDEQWRPQDRFYGVGMGTSIDSLSGYALHYRSARGVARVRWNKRPGAEPRTEFAVWLGTRGQVLRHGREPGTASLEARFPALAAPILNRHQEQLTYGLRFASDWRLGSPHWHEGWRVLVQTERFDKPVRWLAIETTNPGAQFTRTTVELEGTRSFGRDPRSLRLLGRLVQTGVTSGRERLEPDDYARLGGREGIRGFVPGRFHDLNLLMARLSYVFPLQRFLELDLHVESGAVYPDLARSPRFDQLQQTVGMRLRGRTDVHPLGSVGVEWSRETTRLVFTLSNPDR